MKDAIKPNLMQTLEVSRVTPAVLDWLESTVSLGDTSLPDHLFIPILIGLGLH